MARPSCSVVPAQIGGVSILSGMLPLSTAGSTIVDDSGNRYRITGTSLGGFESVLQLAGTWNYPYRTISVAGAPVIGIIDRLAGVGFNCVRILICEDVCIAGAKPKVYINPTYNPDFFADPNDTATVLDGVQVLDLVVAYCGGLGLRVIFDMHALAPNPNNAVATNGLWYTTASRLAASSVVTHQSSDTRNEADWIAAWVALAARYLNNRVVIGADLVNEPWAASWGDGNLETDIAAAYTRAADAIHAVNPAWLVFCEGIYEVLNFGPVNGGYVGVGWGAGLDRAASAPVRPSLANKVVYSPHEYGPGIGNWNYFNVPAFPNNMTAVWNQMYGGLVKNDTAPVWIGEIGDMLVAGANNGADTPVKYQQGLEWIALLMAYCGGQTSTGGSPDVPKESLGFSWSWFCWSTNGYTGSSGSIVNTNLLMGDYNTLNAAVLQSITPHLAPPLLAPVKLAVTVALSGPPRNDAAVHWTTLDGTARAGVHYQAAAGVVIFEPGQTSRTVIVEINPLNAPGSSLDFAIALSTPSGCTLATDHAAITINYV